MAMANEKRDKIQLALEEVGVNSKNAQKDLQKALKEANVNIKAFAAAQKAGINGIINEVGLAPNERKKKQPEQDADAAPAPKSRRLGQ